MSSCPNAHHADASLPLYCARPAVEALPTCRQRVTTPLVGARSDYFHIALYLLLTAYPPCLMLRRMNTSTPANAIESALASVFGREWLRLSHADQQFIVRDCVEDGGVSDLAQYRHDIGLGNLQAYANVMRARFTGNA